MTTQPLPPPASSEWRPPVGKNGKPCAKCNRIKTYCPQHRGKGDDVGGHPTKLTPAVQEKILTALVSGNYRNVAAQWADIAPETFSRWMERGEKEPESPYGLFRQAVLKAEARAHVRAVNRILKAAEKDAKHAQWWLARKYPKEWAEKPRVQVEGVPGGAPIPVEVVLRDVTTEEEEGT